MVEEGREWVAHQNSRAHKNMASKARREEHGAERHTVLETKNEMIGLI